jgi:uncharacterized membrane protein
VASAIGLASTVLSYVFVFVSVSSLVSVAPAGSGSTVAVPPPETWVPLLIAIGVFAAVYLLIYRSAFENLSTVDDRFRTPRLLVSVAIAGVLVVLVGIGLLLETLRQAAECAGAGNPIHPACISMSALSGAVGLLVVGAILALLGAIGLLLGIWRVGSRYDRDLFKVGAILLIIPYVNLVGYALILWESHSVQRTLETAGTPAGFL